VSGSFLVDSVPGENVSSAARVMGACVRDSNCVHDDSAKMNMIKEYFAQIKCAVVGPSHRPHFLFPPFYFPF
jgi:hypothetical protein